MDRRRILCFKTGSDDPYAILTEADYDVVVTSDIQDALRLLSRERFDAVIIGHRFHTEEKYALALEARKSGISLWCWSAAPAPS